MKENLIDQEYNYEAVSALQDQYREILRTATNLNNHILKMITTDKNITLESREILFELMKNNTVLSSELSNKKKQTMFHIINNEVNDKYVKFKNFMAPIKFKLESNTYYDSFSKGIENLWYKLKVGTTLTVKNIKNFNFELFIDNIKHEIEEGQTKVKIKYEQFERKHNEIMSRISFVGEKIEINRIEKKFKDELQFLGVSFEDDKFKFNNSFENFQTNMTEKIQEQLGIKDITQKNIIIPGIDNLDDKQKYNFYDKVLIPILHKNIGKRVDFLFKVGNLTKKNHYLKMLQNFSKSNGLDPDVAKNLLVENPTLLNNTKNFSKILKYKNEILEQYEQNEKLVTMNIEILRSYLNLTQIIKHQIEGLSVDGEQKSKLLENIDKKTIYIEKSQKYTLQDINSNIQKAERAIKLKIN